MDFVSLWSSLSFASVCYKGLFNPQIIFKSHREKIISDLMQNLSFNELSTRVNLGVKTLYMRWSQIYVFEIISLRT